MSYTIRVTVENGTPLLKQQVGQVPDGEFTIYGHRDGQQETLSVTRTDGVSPKPITASMAMPLTSAPAPASESTPAPD